MREIKFRAWSKSEPKEMFRVIMIAFPVGEKRLIISGRGGSTDTSDCILMQYIGLKDKNGKEIFDGDILNVQNQGEYREQEPLEGKCEVKFNDGAFRAFGFYNMLLGEKVCTGSEGNWNMEVIGNIYENPELLEGV
jgi:uncharacterized phage protein (TIGR01671 family)